MEDHNIIGGLGDHFSKGYGSYAQVKEANGLGITDIINAVRMLG